MYEGRPKGFNLNLNKFYRSKRVKKVPVVPSNYDLGLIFGAYLEGGVSHLALNSDAPNHIVASSRWYVPVSRLDFAIQLTETIKRVFGLNASYFHRPEKDGNVVTVICHSQLLSRFFRTLGTKSHEKALPEEYIVDNREFMQGLYDGMKALRRERVVTNPHGKRVVSIRGSPKVRELFEDLELYLGVDKKV